MDLQKLLEREAKRAHDLERKLTLLGQKELAASAKRAAREYDLMLNNHSALADKDV